MGNNPISTGLVRDFYVACSLLIRVSSKTISSSAPEIIVAFTYCIGNCIDLPTAIIYSKHLYLRTTFKILINDGVYAILYCSVFIGVNPFIYVRFLW